MSHIVKIKTQLKDHAAICAACRRLIIADPTYEDHTLYGGIKAEGWGVRLPGWKFPVVIDTATGEAKYDNYQGHWGEQAKLDQFMQLYAVEKAKIEARKKGMAVSDKSMADGSIKVFIREGY